MAVTILAPALAVQLRIVVDESDYDSLPQGQRDVLSRLLETGRTLTEKYAPNAPAAAANEAVIRIAGFLYDRAGAENRGVNPLIASGACYLLSAYRARTLILGEVQ